jgi:Kef-type K+ transport system membrane component KefB
MEASFRPLYEFLSPFFFIVVGMQVDPGGMGAALVPGLALFAVAVAGKLIGTAAPGLAVTSPLSALVIGVSMVPRAEIALIIMQRSLQLGEHSVPQGVFSAMVLACGATCLTAPVVLGRMLRRSQE